jgi:hypothetical protein
MKDLRRPLWRYDAGLLSTEQITGQFHEVIADLVSDYRETLSEPGRELHTGGHEFKFSLAFDKTVNLARGYVVAQSFKQAFEQLRFATAALQELHLAARARREIQEAAEAYRTLFEAVGYSLPASFVTHHAARRLLAKAQQLFDGGESRQSRFVASMCLHECRRLLRINEAGSDEAQALRTRITALCKAQEALLNIPFREDDTSIFTSLAFIEGSLSEGRLVLANCMLDDFEVAVAPRIGFLSEMGRQLGDSGLANRNAVLSLLNRCGIGAQDSWESGTSRLLEHALSELAVKVHELATRVPGSGKVGMMAASA